MTEGKPPQHGRPGSASEAPPPGSSDSTSQFLALMTHELKTPLNIVLGYTELLLEGVPEPLPPSARRHVERARASAVHLLDVLDEVLAFARLEAEEERVHVETVDLVPILREAAAIIRSVAAEKGLPLKEHMPDGLGPVATDPGKVEQIMLRLLSNAIKFTKEGSVTLEAEARDGGVAVSVTDTGIGIAPAHVERIFEPFWQAEPAITRRVGGPGLGLNVARRLARMLGGDIVVESVPGRGSTFTLLLPAARGEPGEAR